MSSRCGIVRRSLDGPSRAGSRTIPLGFPVSPRTAARFPAAARGTTYTISQLAQEFALTTRAIRFYEDEGLVHPQRVGRSRIYGERERVRIKLILRGKRLGLALAEIGELLDMYEVARNERAQLEKFLQMLAERRARLLQQKDDIDATLSEIGALERECRRRLRGRSATAARARQDAPNGAGAHGTG